MQQPDKIPVSSCIYMCYIALERVKLCHHGCTIIECQNENTRIWKLHGNLYWLKKWMKIRMILEKSKECIAKFADCWVKTHQKLSLNRMQCTERILFHKEQLPDGYLISKRGDLVLDEASPGRPVSPTSENDVATFQSIIQQDSRYTVEEIRDLSGSSSTILRERLKL